MTATITEIATALGKSRQAVQKRAKGCTTSGERVKGGGDKYDIAIFPLSDSERAIVQMHLIRKTLANAPAIHQPAPLPAPSATIQPAKTTSQLKQWQRDVMEARTAIMRLIERAAPVVGVNKAILTIVKASVNGELEMYAAANARKGQGRTLSYDGVMKWWISWKKSIGDCMALAPKDTENYLEPVWAEPFLKCWSKPQKPCLTEVLDEFVRLSPSGIPAPTYGQARHYLQKMSMIEREKGRKTGKELQALKPFRRRDTSEMFPGDAYPRDRSDPADG